MEQATGMFPPSGAAASGKVLIYRPSHAARILHG
jgi:hypothetical protein